MADVGFYVFAILAAGALAWLASRCEDLRKRVERLEQNE